MNESDIIMFCIFFYFILFICFLLYVHFIFLNNK